MIFRFSIGGLWYLWHNAPSMQQKAITLSIADQQLRAIIIGVPVSDKPCIVMLHGALDCLESWKDFPADIAKQTGLPVVAYERFGHGGSGQLSGIRNANYRHHEAEITLPSILTALDLKQIILVGHSDGGAMALLAAACLTDTILGVCAITPPLVMDQAARDGIRKAVHQYEHGSLAKKLNFYHGEATNSLFYSWANTWLSKEFDNWSCTTELQKITCPVTLIFGQADDYGYKPSLDLLQTNLHSATEVVLLKDAGHLSHHCARDKTVKAIVTLCKPAGFSSGQAAQIS